MNDYNKISFKIKQQIALFSNKLTDGLFKKPLRRSIKEIIFGIEAQKDVKLSNIARSFGEKITLIKVENRLSNNLKKGEFSSKIIKRLLEDARDYISKV